MGEIGMTQSQIDDMMIDLGARFTGSSYNLLTSNCNHFTAELIQILCSKPIPRWINRLASLGTRLSRK